MDLASVIGLAGAGLIIIVTIIIEGGNPLSYINAAAALTAIGGSCMALLLAFPLDVVKKAPTGLKKVIGGGHSDTVGTVNTLVEMCTVVRREGLLALDPMVQQLTDPFFIKGTQYV